MALSQEDIDQARALLVENERRLRVRDRQIARGGDTVDPALILDAQDIRKKIVALKAVLEPELPDEISGLVRRRADDDYFLFQQVLGANQNVALLREDVAAVKQSQALAAQGRMQTDDRIGRIEVLVNVSEQARKTGAVWYRGALLIALGVAVLALIVSCVALIVGVQ